jgi:hypothetical protein
VKSTIAMLLTLVALACSAAPASAMPADNGPPPAGRTAPARSGAPADANGLGTAVYMLIAVGAALALVTGAYVGARAIHGRRIRLHHG